MRDEIENDWTTTGIRPNNFETVSISFVQSKLRTNGPSAAILRATFVVHHPFVVDVSLGRDIRPSLYRYSKNFDAAQKDFCLIVIVIIILLLIFTLANLPFGIYHRLHLSQYETDCWLVSFHRLFNNVAVTETLLYCQARIVSNTDAPALVIAITTFPAVRLSDHYFGIRILLHFGSGHGPQSAFAGNWRTSSRSHAHVSRVVAIHHKQEFASICVRWRRRRRGSYEWTRSSFSCS